MKKVYTSCDQCDKSIHVGEKMWMKGSECYCTGKCLIESFNENKKEESK